MQNHDQDRSHSLLRPIMINEINIGDYYMKLNLEHNLTFRI